MVVAIATKVGANEAQFLTDGEKPLVTAEEIFGLTYEKTLTTYKRYEVQQGLGQLYMYSSRVEDVLFTYRLLLSEWEPVLRSFERNPDDSIYLDTAYRKDSFAYWEEDMEQLDHEALGAKVAWLVRFDDYFSYRYYLEIDGAAIFIQTEREVEDQWLREICQRMKAVR